MARSRRCAVCARRRSGRRRRAAAPRPRRFRPEGHGRRRRRSRRAAVRRRGCRRPRRTRLGVHRSRRRADRSRRTADRTQPTWLRNPPTGDRHHPTAHHVRRDHRPARRSRSRVRRTASRGRPAPRHHWQDADRRPRRADPPPRAHPRRTAWTSRPGPDASPLRRDRTGGPASRRGAARNRCRCPPGPLRPNPGAVDRAAVRRNRRRRGNPTVPCRRPARRREPAATTRPTDAAGPGRHRAGDHRSRPAHGSVRPTCRSSHPRSAGDPRRPRCPRRQGSHAPATGRRDARPEALRRDRPPSCRRTAGCPGRRHRAASGRGPARRRPSRRRNDDCRPPRGAAPGHRLRHCAAPCRGSRPNRHPCPSGRPGAHRRRTSHPPRAAARSRLPPGHLCAAHRRRTEALLLEARPTRPTTTFPTTPQGVRSRRLRAGPAGNPRAFALGTRDRRCSSVALLVFCGTHHPRRRMPRPRALPRPPTPRRPSPDTRSHAARRAVRAPALTARRRLPEHDGASTRGTIRTRPR